MNTLHLPPARGRKRLGFILGAASLGLGVVAAGHAMGQATSLDTDGDGLVSYTELLIAMPEMSEADFAALDLDESGALDDAELMAAQDAGMVPAE